MRSYCALAACANHRRRVRCGGCKLSERRAADWDFVPRLFVDAARIEQNDRLSFERNVSLWSSGIGCDVLIRRRARLRVDWGVALDDANNGTDEVDAGESRWHVSFVLAF